MDSSEGTESSSGRAFKKLKIVWRGFLIAVPIVAVALLLIGCFWFGLKYEDASKGLLSVIGPSGPKVSASAFQGYTLAFIGVVVLIKGLVFLTTLGISYQTAKDSCRAFVFGGGSWKDSTISMFKLLKYMAIPSLYLGAWFSVSTANGNGIEPKNGPPAIKRVLLPVQLHVNFDNAELDKTGDLSDVGVSVGPAHDAMLKRMLEQLKQCTESGKRRVTVKPHGFASSDEFDGLLHPRSERRNLQAANARGRAVRERLQKLINEASEDRFKGLEVTEARQWNELNYVEAVEEMKKTRNCMIPGPKEKRDSFADRAVVLEVEDPGACEIAPTKAKENECPE